MNSNLNSAEEIYLKYPSIYVEDCINEGIIQGGNGIDRWIEKIGSIMRKGICYKELGEYDDALKLLRVDLDYKDSDISSVQIACCFILKGEIDRGIKLLDSISLDARQLLEVGRALYDVKRFDQSRAYFERRLTKIGDRTRTPDHQVLDGFCKILALENENPNTMVLIETMADNNYKMKFTSFNTTSLLFRWKMFSICCSIQNNEDSAQHSTKHKNLLTITTKKLFVTTKYVSERFSSWQVNGN